ncbi:MAG: Ig-like domain repeat protein [Gemmataceae bacterium]|nr:Ig-like domain repeat protein [Gemmataceae bacterium]
MFKLPWIHSLLTRRNSRQPAPPPQPSPTRGRRGGGPRLEALEDRCVPASFAVTTTNDDGAGSLRAAITAANAAAGADTIDFDASLLGRTITLASSLPAITNPVSINGPAGPSALALPSAGLTTIAGIGPGPTGVTGFPIFSVAASAGQVAINNLTITRGFAPATPGVVAGGLTNNGATVALTNVVVSANSGPQGGLLNDRGTMTLTTSAVIGNTATDTGGGLWNRGGTMTISNSTIANNRSFAGPGGLGGGAGVLNQSITGAPATLTIRGSTIAQNIAAGGGGGVLNFTGTANLVNTTIVGNSSTGGTGATIPGGGGLGTATGSTTNLVHVTLVGNSDVTNAAPFDAGGISSRGGTINAANSIIAQNVAVTAARNDFTPGALNGTITTNFLSDNPLLSPLQNNGGLTSTMLPLLGSPVINGGTNAASVDPPTGTPLTTEQRFVPGGPAQLRRVGANVDIGATEFQPPATTTTLTVAPTGPAPLRGQVTLTANVTVVSTGPNNDVQGTVTFFSGSDVLGTATLDATGQATLTTGQNLVPNLPTGTVSLTARYDGDGVNYLPSTSAVVSFQVLARGITVGAYDPMTGMWLLRNSNTAGPPDIPAFAFGGAGMLPLVGDWDGDGDLTVGVFDPVTATFMLRNSNSAGMPDAGVFAFGPANVGIPLAGDWDGDGVWGVGVFDPTTATFNLKNTLAAGLPDAGTVIYGLIGSKAVVGDWDGDGDWNIGVVEPDGTWKLKNFNLAGPPDFTFAYGSPTSLVVAGDWDGDGVWTPGVADIGGGVLNWSLRNSNSAGAPDAGAFAYGSASNLPVAGDWNFPAPPLTSSAGVGPGALTISTGQLNDLVGGALGRLQAAGVPESVLDGLASVTVQLVSIPGPALGFSLIEQNRIVLDDEGAGHGWFVDLTPGQDEEFDLSGNALAGSGAEGRMDLLTALLHELGHVAGLGDDSGSALMAPLLGTGTRRTHALDAVFAGG